MEIPLANEDIKLIMTTYSLDMCNRIRCGKNIVGMEVLKDNDDDKAQDLFESILLYNRVLHDKVEVIIHECEGLLVVIIEITRSIKGLRGKKGYRHYILLLQNLETYGNESIIVVLEE